MFEPKMIFGPNDWLASTRQEKGMSLKAYAEDPEIHWYEQKRNTIYIFILDDSIEDELTDKYLEYCKAFYHGLPIKMIKPGMDILEKQADG